MPIPKPKGDGTLVADGSPMPIPKPTSEIAQFASELSKQKVF